MLKCLYNNSESTEIGRIDVVFEFICIDNLKVIEPGFTGLFDFLDYRNSDNLVNLLILVKEVAVEDTD